MKMLAEFIERYLFPLKERQRLYDKAIRAAERRGIVGRRTREMLRKYYRLPGVAQ